MLHRDNNSTRHRPLSERPPSALPLPGDSIVVSRKPTGTLRTEYLRPARNLYLLATGTGLAPFMSIIRDPDTYERFEKVLLVHGVRQSGELAYRDHITKELPQHDVLGEMIRQQLLYFEEGNTGAPGDFVVERAFADS